MAQTTSYEIDNDSGSAVRARLNDVFVAIQSSNSGATPPADTAPGMLWLDTSASPSVLYRRNAADSDWVRVVPEIASQAEAEAGTDSAKLMTPLRTAQAIAASGPLAGFRNAIINGNFGQNQRGVSGTVTLAAGAYGHDRWKAGASGCTYTFATVENVTTLTITVGSLVQVIEGANLFTGTYTLSFTGTAQGKIGAGSFGASGTTGSVTGGTNLAIEFNTGTVSQVQLEPGSVATPFERRPVGTELALCQRYYQVATLLFSGNVTSGSIYIARVNFFTPMRVIPTSTRSSLFAENFPTTGTLNRSTTFSEDLRTANGTGRGLFGTEYTADSEL